MPGKHDKAGDDAPSRLLKTGPIAVRGLSRGVKDALRRDVGSRHRAAADDLAVDDTAPAMQEDRPAAGDPLAAATTAASPEQEDPTVVPRRPKDPEDDAGREASDDVVGPTEDPADGRHDDPQPPSPGGEVGADSPLDDEKSGSTETRADERDQDDLFAALGPAEPVRRRRAPALGRLSSGVVGIAVLAVLAIVCAGLIVAVVVKTQNDASVAAREAAAYTPPPLNATTPAAGLSGPIAVVGDDFAQKAARGVNAAARWPRVLADGLKVDLDLQATTGAGYAVAGPSGTFVAAAGKVPSDSSVVLLVGGAADAGSTSLSLARAATEAFSAATQQAPDATVIAVGPLVRPASVSQNEFDALRTTLRSAARIAGVRWIDPVSAMWIPTVASASDLTAVDERAIAARLRAEIDPSA